MFLRKRVARRGINKNDLTSNEDKSVETGSALVALSLSTSTFMVMSRKKLKKKMGRLDPKPKFGACYSKRDDDTSARWQLFGLVRKTRNANYARPNGFLTARAIYWYPQSCAPGRSDDLIIIN